VRRLIFALLVVLSGAHFTMQPAQAYLDPTWASYVVQAIAGTFLAGLFLVKRYWQWIVSKVSRIGSRKKQVDADER
jgi:hypothetical protein